MKQGFTLIEVVVSMLIATILGMALTQLVAQTAQYQKTINNSTSIHSRTALFFSLFEKDLMGAFVPIQNRDTQQDEKKDAQKQLSQQEAQKKNNEQPLVQQVFLIEQAQQQLSRISFITSNPLQVYWSKQVGKAKPKVARVVYTLQQDPENKDSFTIMRQEGDNLDLHAYKATTEGEHRGYEVIDGIRSCSLKCTVFEYQEPDEKQKDATMQKQRVANERITWNWPDEQQEQKDTGADNQLLQSPLPHFITVTIELWDELFERSTSFEYTIPLAADMIFEKEEKKEKEPKDKKQKDTDKTKPQPQKDSITERVSFNLFEPPKQQRSSFVWPKNT